MDRRIIVAKLSALGGRATLSSWRIDGWEVRLADYQSPGEYRYDGDWSKLQEGRGWVAGKTVFLRATAEVPDEAALDSLYLAFNVNPDLEGMLSIDGQPYAGLDQYHPRVRVPRAGKLELAAEFIAIPKVMHVPERAGERTGPCAGRFDQVDSEIEGLWYDLSFAWDTVTVIKDSRRKERISAALEEAMLAIDLTVPQDRFREQVVEARRMFRDRLERIAPDPEGGRICLAGHTHIDVTWLWPIKETIRKCGRTFSTACRLMEQYPEFRFSCSQPQLYAYTKEHFPQLYDQIKHWVRQGRWGTTGGMWVETDCNLASGESLIRQILHGLRFYRDEFGTRPSSCWLPDVFGYPGNLPQILQGCGLDTFFTCKLHWQARNPFPAHLFWWQGIDGSQVLAHIPKLKQMYNGYPHPGQLADAWSTFSEKGVYDEMMFTFGYGDGGGGVTEGMLEYAERAKRYPGLPACRQDFGEKYLEKVQQDAPELPRWQGELYLETHRGTFTSQAKSKRANRKNELLLRDAEIIGVLGRRLGGKIHINVLRGAWELLLLHQFHDDLPGSSIEQVYTDADRDYDQIRRMAGEVLEAGLDVIVKRVPAADVLVFNSLSWSRNDPVHATIAAPSGAIEAVDNEGHAVPAQVVAKQDGRAEVVFAPKNVPAVGYSTFTLRPVAKEGDTELMVTAERIENQFLVIELDRVGQIVRLFDKRCRREVIGAGQAANCLQLFQDGPEKEAAWNVHDTFDRRQYPFEGETSIDVIETGPVRGVVRVVRHHRDSRIAQDIVIHAGCDRIDFVNRVQWQQRQVMLKAAFPVQVLSDRATYEVQFGAVDRPTHRNTSWDQQKFEVPAQRWADISEAGYGVSLLNDCKYGYDVKDNVLRITLLRGPEWPDPNADRGYHEFTYSLLPHSGDWREGQTVRRAWELNVPMICRAAKRGDGSLPAAQSFIELAGPAVLETLKPADDGDGLIVRVYEPDGGRGEVTISLQHKLQNVTACNLVEEAQGPQSFEGNRFTFDIGPFQIRTFRLH